MMLLEGFKEILKIQKFRRIVSYTGFYCFTALVAYAYTNNTTRAGYSRADQYYASYPAGIQLLTDTAKLYKAALGNCFESEDWGPIEYCIMAKHFERQGKSPYAYHAILVENFCNANYITKHMVHGIRSSYGRFDEMQSRGTVCGRYIWRTFFLMDNLMEVGRVECDWATRPVIIKPMAVETNHYLESSLSMFRSRKRI